MAINILIHIIQLDHMFKLIEDLIVLQAFSKFID